MEKKLPKVFVNQTNKKFNNNDKIFCSIDKNRDDSYKNDRKNKNIESTKTLHNKKNIYQKISEIFTSEKYIYKAEVEIKTNKGVKTAHIIGQNRTHLITIDNELIPITDIEDIYYAN